MSGRTGGGKTIIPVVQAGDLLCGRGKELILVPFCVLATELLGKSYLQVPRDRLQRLFVAESKTSQRFLVPTFLPRP